MSLRSSIGIMGGTFDPIHNGHLVIAECARHEFQLDQVVFVPCGSPPHKKDYDITDAKHRYRMVELAVAGNPYFRISPVEIERQGISYAIDTLKIFQTIYGTDTELFFITGADAIVEILTWKKVDEVMEMCSFIAATRPGYSLPQLNKAIRSLPPGFQRKIITIEIPGIAVSSTEIRRRVQAGRPIKYLLPEAVEQYIVKHGIW